MSPCTSLYFTVLHCTSLYFTVLHCTSLYFTVLHLQLVLWYGVCYLIAGCPVTLNSALMHSFWSMCRYWLQLCDYFVCSEKDFQLVLTASLSFVVDILAELLASRHGSSFPVLSRVFMSSMLQFRFGISQAIWFWYVAWVMVLEQAVLH